MPPNAKSYADSNVGASTVEPYLRKNYNKVATSILNNTASFTAVTASAPDGITATSETDFLFFNNGQIMEHDAITIQQAGSTFLLKVDSLGDYEWSHQYGGNEYDGAERVLFNSSLGVYTIGSSNSIGEGDYNGMVMHADELGNEIWTKAYGTTNSWEFLYDAVFTKDTSILMVGSSRSISSGEEHVYLLSVNRYGDTLWTKTLTDWESSSANSIAKIEDSLFIIGGTHYSQDSLIKKGFLMKISSNGDEIWRKTVGPLSGEYVVHDVVLGDGNFYAIGARELNEDNHDLYRACFDFEGNTIIEKTDIDDVYIRDHIGDEIVYIPSLGRTLLGYRSINEFTFQVAILNMIFYEMLSLEKLFLDSKTTMSSTINKIKN